MTIATAAARTTELAGQTDNPFVAWDNKAAGAGVTYTGAATLAGGAASNAFNGSTTEYWLANVTTTTAGLWVVFPTAVTVNFVGLAAHNTATLGATVRVQRSTDGGTTWNDAGAGTITPTDNSTIGFRMKSTGNDATHWRLWWSGLTVGAPLAVGAAFFGNEIVMPTRFYDGFSPAITATEVQLQSNVTVGGNFAGQSVVATGTTLKADFQHLDPAFVRGTFLPFQSAFNRGNPFFFAWRPATWATDLHYCWRDGEVIRPTNAGGLNLMGLSISARAYEPAL